MTVTGQVAYVDNGFRIVHIVGDDGRNYFIDYLNLFHFGHRFQELANKYQEKKNGEKTTPLTEADLLDQKTAVHGLRLIDRHIFSCDRLAQLQTHKAILAMTKKQKVRVWGTFRPFGGNDGEYDVARRYDLNNLRGGDWEHPLGEFFTKATQKYASGTGFVMTAESKSDYWPNARSNLVVLGVDDDELPSVNIGTPSLRAGSTPLVIVGRVRKYDGRSFVMQIEPIRVWKKDYASKRPHDVLLKEWVDFPKGVRVFMDAARVTELNTNITMDNWILKNADDHFLATLAKLSGALVTISGVFRQLTAGDMTILADLQSDSALTGYNATLGDVYRPDDFICLANWDDAVTHPSFSTFGLADANGQTGGLPPLYYPNY